MKKRVLTSVSLVFLVVLALIFVPFDANSDGQAISSSANTLTSANSQSLGSIVKEDEDTDTASDDDSDLGSSDQEDENRPSSDNIASKKRDLI